MTRLIISTMDLKDTDILSEWNFSYRLMTVPLIQKEFSYDSEVEERIFSLGREKINAIFTSEVAVSSVFERLEYRPDWNIFCLGGKTRSAILKFLPNDDIPLMGNNSRELCDYINTHAALNKTLPAVFFCGDRRMPTIPAYFANQNIALEEVVCYKSRCLPASLNGEISGLLFFSPSAVKCYSVANKQISPKTVFFSIGPTTSRAIAELYDNTIITAPEPSESALLLEIKRYFEAQENN